MRSLTGLIQANDTSRSLVSYKKLRHSFHDSIDMVKCRDSCQFHGWARPAERGPSLFKVMLSESVHIAPLAQSLIFTRKLAAIRV